MKTQIDESSHWFLHGITYQDGDLTVYLAEGVRSEPRSVTILGATVEGVRSVDVSDESRLFLVRFRQIVAWQVVDESFTQWDDYEVRDDTNTIQCISRSRYLDYVDANHGWFEMTLGPASHYRVSTLTDLVDVVCCEPPVVEEWSSA